MTLRFLLFTLALANGLSAQQRDVVLVVADDLRYDQLAFMPLTDSLIGDRGVRFTRAFASSPMCCPSRAGLLTGLYSHNHGVLSNSAPSGGATVFDDRSTLATWLSDGGYRTALFGKYLNEYGKLGPKPYVPPGWRRWYVLKSDGGYFDFRLVTKEGEIEYSGQTDSTYATNVLAGRAAQFIRTTDPGRRLFAYVAPHCPHTPATPAPLDNGTFAGLAGPRPPSFDEEDVHDKPGWVRALPRLTQADVDTLDAIYRRQAECVQAVDRLVAKLVDALADAGREDAAFIFTSDQGLLLGEHRVQRLKANVYDETLHVPLLIRVPGVAPRDEAALVSLVDVPATIADLAGVATPAMNGRSLVPLLNDPTAPRRDALFFEMRTSQRRFFAVRTESWKYVEYDATGEQELYRLSVDPFELQNLEGKRAFAAKQASLAARLAQLRAE